MTDDRKTYDDDYGRHALTYSDSRAMIPAAPKIDVLFLLAREGHPTRDVHPSLVLDDNSAKRRIDWHDQGQVTAYEVRNRVAAEAATAKPDEPAQRRVIRNMLAALERRVIARTTKKKEQ